MRERIPYRTLEPDLLVGCRVSVAATLRNVMSHLIAYEGVLVAQPILTGAGVVHNERRLVN